MCVCVLFFFLVFGLGWGGWGLVLGFRAWGVRVVKEFRFVLGL